LPIEGQPDEEQTGSQPTGTKQLPKPTANLPGDHGEAEGEASQPGLTTKPESTAETNPGSDGAGEVPAGAGDEGFFDNIMALSKSSTWIFGAAGFILLAAGSAAAFFIIRTRRNKKNLFEQLSGGERGAYQPVGEDVQMGLLGRGRQKLMGAGGAESGTSKVLYDAFAEGESENDDDDDVNEEAALKYHDDFLEDEAEDHGGHPEPAGEYADDESSATSTPVPSSPKADSTKESAS
jgi:kexin